MKKEYVSLIHYLCDASHAVTSKQLAMQLGISVRTIKNYVNTLNTLANEKMIISSHAGYRIHKKIAMQLLDNNTNDIPQTSEERGFYIIKQLLINHASHVNIFDLCEELYVSYSTLKNDLIRMNVSFSNFHISFSCENDMIILKGTEKNKRRLVSYVIFEETNNTFMSIENIRDVFGFTDIEKISFIILSTFKKYNYYLNEFSKMSLLLHIVIMINRMKEGNIVSSMTENFIIEDPIEHDLVYELCNCFEKDFSITFNQSEQFEIYMLFKTNANCPIPSNQKTLQRMVDKTIMKLAKDMVEKINELYYIDLSHENFLIPFTLHLNNLIVRAKNNSYTKNPMTQNIKVSCPTVYDIAIYISLELMEKYNIQIIEDEVTFLALHIGSEIERQKTNEEKIKCLLLCPEYMNMNAQIYNQLLLEFSHQIDIIKTITTVDELAMYDFDMCITTIPVAIKMPNEVILVSPFMQQQDKNKIYDTIGKVNHYRKSQILKHNFSDFFNASLFVTDTSINNKDEIIHILADKMLEMHYVDETFEEKVHIRENAASTAFDQIAIPHAMKMEALKTSIGVCISKKGIRWNNRTVHIVLLLAINKADKRIFHDLYEILVELFNNNTIINLVKECKTFTDFENVITVTNTQISL
jgi:lichenan operon transcriptional antiterminator